MTTPSAAASLPSASRPEALPRVDTPTWVAHVATVASVAPAVFFAVMTVLGLVTPGYSSISRFGSELSLGPLGPVMIANFILLGICMLALAVALARVLGDRFSGWIAALAVGVTGAAFVVAGVCVTDPATLVSGPHSLHGMIHAFMAVVIFFLATPAAALAMARRCRASGGFAGYCLTVAAGTPLLLIVTFVSGSLVGLTERVVIAFVLVWLTVLAVRLRRGDLP